MSRQREDAIRAITKAGSLTIDEVVQRFEFKRRTSRLDHVVIGIKVRMANGHLRSNHKRIAVNCVDKVRVFWAQRIFVYHGEESWSSWIESRDSVNERKFRCFCQVLIATRVFKPCELKPPIRCLIEFAGHDAAGVRTETVPDTMKCFGIQAFVEELQQRSPEESRNFRDANHYSAVEAERVSAPVKHQQVAVAA
jgi:hypothetical protein